mgnify:CR=1 FL=1
MGIVIYYRISGGMKMASEQLVEVVRGNLVESIHNGHIAVVDYKGRLLASKGDVEKVIFARS